MAGIVLKTGGTWNNALTILGTAYGVEIYGGTGTVLNTGSISTAPASTGYGIQLKDGGSVTNYAGGYIGGATAISLLDGGTVTNAAGATIDSRFDSTHAAAVYVKGAAGTISNSGSIYALDDQEVFAAIYLADGGSVTNASTGQIAGDIYEEAIDIKGDDGLVTNAGKLRSSTAAVFMGAGGTVTNTGEIYGSLTLGVGATVTNSGEIFGSSSTAGGAVLTGVMVGAGATVVNQAGGAIQGGGAGVYGIYIKGGGAIQNAGTIRGAKGAIRFKGTGANTLTLETGSLLKGAVIGSVAKGASNKLVLEGSGTANNAFSNFDKLSMATSGKWTLGGVSAIGVTKLSAGKLAITGKLTTTLDATATSAVKIGGGGKLKLDGASVIGGAGGLANAGLLKQSGAVTLGDAAILTNAATGIWDIDGGGGIALGTSAHASIQNSGLFENTGAGVSVISPSFVNSGSVAVSAGTLDFVDAVSGTGSDTISGAATLEFDQSAADTQTIDFAGAGGVLDLGSPAEFSGAISGYGAGDALSLLGSWSITGFSQTGASQGALMLNNGTTSASLTFDGSYSQSSFNAAIGAGHTTITYA